MCKPWSLEPSASQPRSVGAWSVGACELTEPGNFGNWSLVNGSLGSWKSRVCELRILNIYY